ncbi:cupredoxin domain-containing protein [Halostagnicola kamekurae]|uniref:Copper binding protein, plastocyanin/azurin family n=1 Tax=Halostagnicola kamekurae TaxID=619731 RepID=A0A1I6QC23_9EURY|nr:hypothetical protein [Halostagnicola kamekurae]SFS49895.1 hypothetical protein SAMN04488556_1155 [Halostagnicola kamekurae]
MERTDSIARRRALALAGSLTTTALVAGCLGDDEAATTTDESSNDGGSDSDGDGSGENDGESEGDDDTERDDTDDEKTGSESTSPDAWADVEEIRLSATTSRFKGVEPALIEGQENPTLVLTEGQEYVITWENEDGQSHNLELWDENERIVDGHSTEVMAEKNETRSLEFEATAAMTEYVCRIHVDWGKRGDIEVVT